MKTLHAFAGISTFVLITATMATAQAAPAAPDRTLRAEQTRTELIRQLDARFAGLDTNRDGRITPAERRAAGAAHAAERFAALDSDHNGALSPAEFQAGSAHGSDNHGHRRGPRGDGRHGHGPHGRGTDRDAIVTKADFEAHALARFDRLDADHNGTVTAAERDQARIAWRHDRS